MRSLYAVCLLCLTALPLGADVIDDVVKEELAMQKIPGAAIVVIRAGERTKVEGYGIADVQTETPVTAESVFRLASVTKPITATLILMLQEKGSLSLEEPVGKYLRDLPESWNTVTIRRLLNQTSGIPNYTAAEEFSTVSEGAMTLSDVVRLTSKMTSHPAGEQFQYSNTNYLLLGQIAEAATETAYSELIATAFAEPLHAKTLLFEHAATAIPNRVRGYDIEGKPADELNTSWPGAAGGLVASADDMARWIMAFDRGMLLHSPALQEMFAPPTLADGSTSKYAFGWNVGKSNGYTEHAHAGMINGFSTYIARYSEQKLTVAVLANREFANVERIAERVAASIHQELLPKPDSPAAVQKSDISEKVKALYLQIAAGTANRDDFTPELANLVFSNIDMVAGLLKAQGEPKAFVLLETTQPPAGPEYKYRVETAGGNVLIRISWNTAGKVQTLMLRPE